MVGPRVLQRDCLDVKKKESYFLGSETVEQVKMNRSQVCLYFGDCTDERVLILVRFNQRSRFNRERKEEKERLMIDCKEFTCVIVGKLQKPRTGGEEGQAGTSGMR